jgi:hypothetical protein
VKRHTLRLLSPTIALAALLSGGCAQTFDASVTGVETVMASPGAVPAAGEPFSVTKTSVFALWGVLPLSRASLEGVIASQAHGEQQVADLRIKVRSKFKDVLITVLTLGIFVPRSVTFEGVIVEP